MSTRQHTIAIVEDDPSLRKALGRLLRGSGYRVQLFASGEAALKGLPGSQVCCVLIDCQLGSISGVELARQLCLAGIQLPIIFMTGSDNDDMRREAMGLGCVAYLNKPFVESQLLDAIASAIRLSLVHGGVQSL